MAWHFRQSGGWAKPLYNCTECRKRIGSRLRPRQFNCSKNFPEDYDSLSDERAWVATYTIDSGQQAGEEYYPDFDWHECPVSTLTAPRDSDWDPVQVVDMLMEARTLGRGAVLSLCKRDARLYDAAVVIEQCSAERRAAFIEATTPRKQD